MKSINRANLSCNIHRVVIKLGSLAVTKEDGDIKLDNLKSFVEDIAALKKSNPKTEIVIVTSGAVNAGKSFLALDDLTSNKEMAIKQAAAAIGQPLLMHVYSELFKGQQLTVAQILLIHDDIKNKVRYLNTKNCLQNLMQNNIIPIINENDTVSFEEISVGDNDNLAIMIAELISADLILFLTEADGLFTKNPKEDGAKKFETVALESFNIDEIDLSTKTSVGRGGMRSKFESIRKVN
ncbi:MAG: glutamate 5-kinase, partial [Bdellovibrionales bacterium RIFOXYC2_FULL_39_8]